MNHGKNRPASIEEALEFWCECFPERRENRPVEREKSGECHNLFGNDLANARGIEAEPSRRASAAG